MINFPKVMKVGGFEVAVKFPYEFTERSDLDGQAVYGPHEIRISCAGSIGDHDDQEVVAIFIHELLHHICHVYNGEEQIEEKVLAGIAQGIFQVLRDNDFSGLREFFGFTA